MIKVDLIIPLFAALLLLPTGRQANKTTHLLSILSIYSLRALPFPSLLSVHLSHFLLFFFPFLPLFAAVETSASKHQLRPCCQPLCVFSPYDYFIVRVSGWHTGHYTEKQKLYREALLTMVKYPFSSGDSSTWEEEGLWSPPPSSLEFNQADALQCTVALDCWHRGLRWSSVRIRWSVCVSVTVSQCPSFFLSAHRHGEFCLYEFTFGFDDGIWHSAAPAAELNGIKQQLTHSNCCLRLVHQILYYC